MKITQRIYLREVEKIKKLQSNPELRGMVDEAYELYNKIRKLNVKEKERSQELVRLILDGFFKDQFSESYSVPVEFIESEIGHILFSLKFGVAEREYTATEVTAIMDVTRALISYDKKNSGLKSIEKGRNTVIYEGDLITYMKSKGMTKDEIDDRLSRFSKLRLEGLDIEEIKEQIRKYIKSKYSS